MKCPHCGAEIQKFTLQVTRIDFAVKLDGIYYQATGEEALPRSDRTSRQVSAPRILYVEPIHDNLSQPQTTPERKQARESAGFRGGPEQI